MSLYRTISSILRRTKNEMEKNILNGHDTKHIYLR